MEELITIMIMIVYVSIAIYNGYIKEKYELQNVCIYRCENRE